MPNRVAMHADGYMEQSYSGNQSSEGLARTIERALELIGELRHAGKSVHVLVDVTHLGKLGTAPRRDALEALKHTDFDRVAIFGADIFTKAIINLIISASGREHRIKTFATKDEALQWLERYGNK